MSPAQRPNPKRVAIREQIMRKAWCAQPTTLPLFLLSTLTLFRKWFLWLYLALLVGIPTVVVPLYRGRKIDPREILVQTISYLVTMFATLLLISIVGWFWMERRYPCKTV